MDVGVMAYAIDRDGVIFLAEPRAPAGDRRGSRLALQRVRCARGSPARAGGVHEQDRRDRSVDAVRRRVALGPRPGAGRGQLGSARSGRPGRRRARARREPTAPGRAQAGQAHPAPARRAPPACEGCDDGSDRDGAAHRSRDGAQSRPRSSRSARRALTGRGDRRGPSRGRCSTRERARSGARGSRPAAALRSRCGNRRRGAARRRGSARRRRRRRMSARCDRPVRSCASPMRSNQFSSLEARPS